MIAFTGIGAVTPIGIGKEHFWHNLMKGYSGVKRTDRLLPSREIFCGEISGLNADKYIDDSRFRRAAVLSKYALIATQLAIDDANITKLPGKNTALVMGITNGPLTYTQNFHRTLITEGVDALSPSLFSESVLNAPASNISICFGIEGSVQTLLGGRTTALKALILAYQLMTLDECDKALIVCSEELNELSLSCYSRLGDTILSEGAGAILIEKLSGMEGPHPYCYLAGMASYCNPSNPLEALAEVIQKSLETAGLEFGDIDFIVTDPFLASLHDLYLNKIPCGCINPLTGNAFSAAAMWDIILSSLVLKYGVIPASVRTNNLIITDEIEHIMICSVEEKGVAAAIVLSKYV